jgi:hypothetical protein
MRFSPKKFVAVAVGTATVGLGIGAYAYFTQPGSGTGAASAGSATAIEVVGTASTTLYPGTSSNVAITVTNPGQGHQFVGTVSLASVTTDAAHSACDMSDFTMADVPVNANLAGGGNTNVSGSLAMADDGNQDACKGAPLTLHLTSN